MVVAILSGVIFAANVDHSVAGGKESWVTGANEGRRLVGGEHTEKVNGKGLVGMEMTTKHVS